MKLRDNKLTSESEENNGSRLNKIELVKCPRGGFNCASQLSEINNFYQESDQYRTNKEYQQAIFLLKDAFDKTFELQQETCLKCAELFRLEIISSLENMMKDMKGMKFSIFKKKNRYEESNLLAQATLKEFTEKNAAFKKHVAQPSYHKLGS